VVRRELSGNQISSVSSEAFAGLGNLQYLYLYNNQISSLEAGAFAGLGNLEILILNENPLVCKVLLPPSLVFDSPNWYENSILPSNYSQLPNCSTTPATTDLPAWLAKVAASGRFSDPRCAESRSMFDLVRGLREDPGLYVSGALGSLSAGAFGIWACIANHPCLQAVGAGQDDDRMCYAVEHRSRSDTVLHAWGLASQVRVDLTSCASNRRHK